jgi:hypothetical protein
LNHLFFSQIAQGKENIFEISSQDRKLPIQNQPSLFTRKPALHLQFLPNQKSYILNLSQMQRDIIGDWKSLTILPETFCVES